MCITFHKIYTLFYFASSSVVKSSFIDDHHFVAFTSIVHGKFTDTGGGGMYHSLSVTFRSYAER